MSPIKRRRVRRPRATSHHAANVPKPRRTKLRHRRPAWAQSLELLKIAVHVTIASVLFMRELLPTSAFGDRCLDKPEVGRMYSHEDFLARDRGTRSEGRITFNGTSKFSPATEGEKPHASKYAWVKMIERGMDDVGDEIRDTLNDIFDGLARRRLRYLQLHVKEENDVDGHRPHMLETYTMSFRYGGKRGTADELDDTIDTGLNSKSLRDIRKYIYNMSRKLTMLKDALAPPSYRSLRICMSYNEGSPLRAGYDVSSLPANTERRGALAPELDQNWNEITLPGGRFDSGYHIVELEVRYFQCRALVPFCTPAEPTTERNT